MLYIILKISDINCISVLYHQWCLHFGLLQMMKATRCDPPRRRRREAWCNRDAFCREWWWHGSLLKRFKT